MNGLHRTKQVKQQEHIGVTWVLGTFSVNSMYFILLLLLLFLNELFAYRQLVDLNF